MFDINCWNGLLKLERVNGLIVLKDNILYVAKDKKYDYEQILKLFSAP